jgi:DNA-binding GntR family transcriptional regulator
MNIDLAPSSTLKKAIGTPINRKALTNELVGHLREMICSGQLRAGTRFTMIELCRRFGVTPTPLRKALKMLAVEGLVIRPPGKSAIVARPSRERIDELIPIIGALEVLASELACERLDDSGVKHLRLLYQRCVDSFQGRDVSSYMDTDTTMRDAIFEFASNRKLIDLYRILHSQLRLPDMSGTSLPEWSKAVQEQDHVLRALEMKDAYLCSLVTRRYMRHRVAILQALASANVGDQRRRKRGGAANAAAT